MAIDIGELTTKIIFPNTAEARTRLDADPCSACPDTDTPASISIGKRFFDLLLGSILCLVLSPMFMALMIVVKLDAPGPAIFYQKRLGRHGQEFKCYKYRTMHQSNRAILEKHLQNNPTIKADWDKFAKLRGNDPRITRSGKWLRRWSLDELPQLLNVLRGDMSLVGPRPYLPRERNDMRGEDSIILSVLPGITGLWQVGGRNDIEFIDRLQLDCWYVVNRSLRLDIAILFKTIPAVFSQRGAY